MRGKDVKAGWPETQMERLLGVKPGFVCLIACLLVFHFVGV